MKPSFPVYVFTSDKYLYTLKSFAHLFNKYWDEDQRVIVGGFTPPDFDLPSNFQFYSIGRMEDYPVDKWSNAIGKFLQHFKDPIFCFMLEDYWITGPTNDNVVDMLADYMRQFEYVIKVDLVTDRRYAKDAIDYGMVGNVPLVKSHYNSPYHMSLMCGLWNRSHFLKILIPDESPWEVEMRGTTRLAEFEDDLVVIGTKSWNGDNDRLCPVPHTLALRGGDSSKLMLEELKSEDVEELRELGYIE